MVAVNTLGSISSKQSLRKKPSPGIRSGAAFPFEEVPDLHNVNEDKPLIVENTLELSLLSKGADFAEGLAERVFGRKLHKHFVGMLSQFFGENDDYIVTSIQQGVIGKGHYSDLPTHSIDRKMQTLAFSYLAPLQGELTRQNSVEAGVLVAGNAYNAVKASHEETALELAGMGLLNGVVSESLLSAKLLMITGIIDSAINIIEKNLDEVEQLKPNSLGTVVTRQALEENLEFSEQVSTAISNRLKDSTNELLAQAQLDALDRELSLRIETDDGDSIKISFLENINSSLLINRRLSETNSIHYFPIQKSRNSNILVGVDAALNADENIALHQFLAHVLALSEQFFISDIRRAFSDATDEGFTMEEIAAFSLDMHRCAKIENIKTYENVALAVDEQVLNPSQTQTYLGPLQIYIHQLHRMLLRGEAFGIKESDHFIEKSLLAAVSLDKRQKYTFLRTDTEDEVLVETLIQSVRAVM